MKKFVRSDIRIRSSATKILEALLKPEQLKNWWGVDNAFIEPKDNGLYTITWLTTPDGIKFIKTGKISLFNRRSHLEVVDLLYINSEKGIFGPFKLRFDIEEKSSYSILKVTQSGFEKGPRWDWYYKAAEDGWPEALIMLKKYIESQSSND